MTGAESECRKHYKLSISAWMIFNEYYAFKTIYVSIDLSIHWIHWPLVSRHRRFFLRARSIGLARIRVAANLISNPEKCVLDVTARDFGGLSFDRLPPRRAWGEGESKLLSLPLTADRDNVTKTTRRGGYCWFIWGEKDDEDFDVFSLLVSGGEGDRSEWIVLLFLARDAKLDASRDNVWLSLMLSSSSLTRTTCSILVSAGLDFFNPWENPLSDNSKGTSPFRFVRLLDLLLLHLLLFRLLFFSSLLKLRLTDDPDLAGHNLALCVASGTGWGGDGFHTRGMGGSCPTEKDSINIFDSIHSRFELSILSKSSNFELRRSIRNWRRPATGWSPWTWFLSSRLLTRRLLSPESWLLSSSLPASFWHDDSNLMKFLPKAHK